jgi:hypothetical protein
MGAAYHTYRTITTLAALVRLTLQLRRCLNPACPPWRNPYRPAPAGRLALPHHAFGLDGLTCIGARRSASHRRVPDIQQALGERGGARAPRTVTKLWERSEALVALSRHATARLRRLTPPPGRGIVALDGLQPAVGQEVLWGLRAGLAGAVRLARRLRSATHPD